MKWLAWLGAAMFLALLLWWALFAARAPGGGQSARGQKGDADSVAPLPGGSDEGSVAPTDGPAEDGPILAGEPAPPASHAAIEGVVVDPEGKGIADVRLMLFKAGDPHDVDLQALGRLRSSDAHGRFRFEGLDSGRYLVVPFHPLYAHDAYIGLLETEFWEAPEGVDDGRYDRDARSADLLAEVPLNGSDPAALRIQMEPGPSVLLRFVDPEKRPVAGVHVRANTEYYADGLGNGFGTPSELRDFGLGRSDAEGRLSLACIPGVLGTFGLSYAHPEWVGERSGSIELAAGDEVVLQLTAPASFAGRVLTAEGLPAAGVRVRAMVDSRRGEGSEGLIFGEGRWIARAETETDELGEFQIPVAPHGEVTLYAWPEEEWPRRAEHEAGYVRSGTVVEDLELTLRGDRVFVGFLLDAAGTPIPGEYVYVRGSTGNDERRVFAHTDGAGRFALRIEQDEAFDIVLGTGGREEILAAGLRLQGSAGPQRFTVRATPSFEMIIRARGPAGQFLPRFLAYVDLDGRNGLRWRAYARTGSASVGVRGDPPYAILIRGASAADGSRLGFAPVRHVIAEVPQGPVTIQLSETGRFEGRMVDQDGEAVQGAFRVRETDPTLVVSTTEDGAFHFEGPAAGAFELSVDLVAPDHARIVGSSTLRAGSVATLELATGGVVVSGQVRTEERADGVPGVEVWIRWMAPGDDGGEEEVRCTTDADGRFRLAAVPAGVQATVHLTGGALGRAGLLCDQAEQTVLAGARELVFVVRRGLTIEGRLAGPGLVDLPDEDLELVMLPWHGMPRSLGTATTPTRSAPTFVMGALEAGSYRLALRHRTSQQLLGWSGEVEAGATDAILHLPRLSGVVSGTIDLSGVDDEADVGLLLIGPDDLLAFRAVAVDEQGHFRVEGLLPTGRYGLLLSVYGADSKMQVALAQDVAPGAPLRLVPRPALEIAGVVRPPADEALPDFVLAVGQGIYGLGRVVPGRNGGHFKVTGLPAGTYQLRVLRTGELDRGIDFPVLGTAEAGAQDVVLRVP